MAMSDEDFTKTGNKIARDVLQKIREECKLHAPDDVVTQGQLQCYAGGLLSGVLERSATIDPMIHAMFVLAREEGVIRMGQQMKGE
jgi:hypothetical protein